MPAAGRTVPAWQVEPVQLAVKMGCTCPESVDAGPHVVHAPPEHVEPAAQVIAQLPQWLGSVAVSTQVEPHSVRPELHVHIEDAQVVPDGQLIPQAPQFVALLDVSTQVPPQSVKPVGQTHALALQTFPPEHTVVQEPQ